MKDTLIFDLDGTLLDTITDIATSINKVLDKYHFPTHSLDTYKYFVGNGFEKLTRRAIPENVKGEEFENISKEMKDNYRNNCKEQTQPYEGIIDLLKILNDKKIKIAVLSNKPHEFVKPTIESYFPDIHFEMLLGARPNIPVKPAPDGVYDIIKELGCKKENSLFIGDTSVDIQTGVSAGVDTIGVLWGFRKKEELIEAGAKHIVDKPLQILNFI